MTALSQLRDPLGHLKITEISTGLLASYCGRLFADLGARVQRVNASAQSTLRDEPPCLDVERGGSLLAPYLADGKRTLALAPDAADFHERLDEVLKETDILIEDSWPGRLFAESHAPEQLVARHPDLVVISLSPFGRTGPYRSWTGGELCAEAFGGLSYLTGDAESPPLKLAGNVYQYAAAVDGFNGGLAAARLRREDGAGRVVDVSLAECVASRHEYVFLYTSLGLVSRRSPVAEPFYFPCLPFPCADGFLELGICHGSDAEAQAAMAAFLDDEELGRDPRFGTLMDCYLNHREMGERIRAGIRDRKRAELFDRATSLGITSGPVSTPEEVSQIPQLEARGFWKSIELPSGRTSKAPGSPLRLSTHPRVREHRDAAHAKPAGVSPLRHSGRRPLEGVRVIDFTIAFAGPMVTRILAELGADVIRVGSLRYLWRGLNYAIWPENHPGAEPWNRQPYYLDKFLGKREIGLEVSEPRGRELLEELLAISDVFVENHSPRALAKLGLTYPELAEKFPHLIMASVSGFGQEGPWGPRVATGDVVEGLASVSYCTGYPGGDPERAGNTVMDALAGATAAAAVTAALEYRAEHGHGLYLDQSMLEAAVAVFPETVLSSAADAPYPIRDGSRHVARAPHDFYPCRGDDQWIAIDVDSERAWQGLGRALDCPRWLEDARFASARSRVENREALDASLAEVTHRWDKIALAEKLQGVGVSAAPALDLRELVLNSHLQERGLIQKVWHAPTGWRTWIRAFPGCVGGCDVSIPRAAPALGEHNEEILGGLLGLSGQELRQLERDGVIGRDPVAPSAVEALDPERYLEYPGIREHDPAYRERLGLDEPPPR